MFSLRSTLRLFVGTCVLLIAGVCSTPPAPAAAADSTVAAAPEVRLRKLHLARPDLILYPIHFDYVC